MTKLEEYKELANGLLSQTYKVKSKNNEDKNATYKIVQNIIQYQLNIRPANAILDLLNRLEIAKKALEYFSNESCWFRIVSGDQALKDIDRPFQIAKEALEEINK